MAYSELIKNFQRVRNYMRQFYVYGFKSRLEYDSKSARSYDNERRRIESWLAGFMSFRQTPEGKHVFLSVDSRAIPSNPLYNAFKAKSFTSGDVIFHFYVLDMLRDGNERTASRILDCILDEYLHDSGADWQPDLSTVRKKLKEYEQLGLLKSEKRGRDLFYSRREDAVALDAWADTLAFFSEVNPLGVVGSFLLDKLEQKPDYFRFKHHYILHTLDSQILLSLLTAIGQHRRITLTSSRDADHAVHEVCPLKIYISTQSGRQYLLCYHFAFRRLTFFRLDFIQAVKAGDAEPDFDRYTAICDQFRSRLWGISTGPDYSCDHLEMDLYLAPHENFILQRLEREKRNGTVERLDETTCRYRVDTCNAMETLPWLRTFTGRILRLECSNPNVETRFWQDLQQMDDMYGGDT